MSSEGVESRASRSKTDSTHQLLKAMHRLQIRRHVLFDPAICSYIYMLKFINFGIKSKGTEARFLPMKSVTRRPLVNLPVGTWPAKSLPYGGKLLRKGVPTKLLLPGSTVESPNIRTVRNEWLNGRCRSLASTMVKTTVTKSRKESTRLGCTRPPETHIFNGWLDERSFPFSFFYLFKNHSLCSPVHDEWMHGFRRVYMVMFIYTLRAYIY